MPPSTGAFRHWEWRTECFSIYCRGFNRKCSLMSSSITESFISSGCSCNNNRLRDTQYKTHNPHPNWFCLEIKISHTYGASFLTFSRRKIKIHNNNNIRMLWKGKPINNMRMKSNIESQCVYMFIEHVKTCICEWAFDKYYTKNELNWWKPTHCM